MYSAMPAPDAGRERHAIIKNNMDIIVTIIEIRYCGFVTMPSLVVAPVPSWLFSLHAVAFAFVFCFCLNYWGFVDS